MSNPAPAKAHLYYATDTYCVWCWGFGPALRTFADQNADRVEIDVIPCSMYVAERAEPVGQKERVKENAYRVAELCQVEFGDGFFNAVEDGNTVLDSAVAAKAFCALRELLGVDQGLEISHALQHAWYWEGKDLNDHQVLKQLASSLGADPEEFFTEYAKPETEVSRLAEVARRDILPINGYPTLLLEMPDGTHQRIGAPTSSAERLQHLLEAHLAGESPEPDPDES